MTSVQHDVPLAPHTTLRVGGAAERWLEVRQLDELRGVLRESAAAGDNGGRLELLGGGSNVLVADRGLAGTVITLAHCSRSSQRQGDDVLVDVDAGHGWDELVAWTVANSLAGLECLSGIPGKVGAAPMQNVGAYGQEVSQTITKVVVVDRATGDLIELSNEDCQFAYRESVFKHEAAGRYVVWSVQFRLRRNGAPLIAYPELARAVNDAGEQTVQQVRNTVIRLRRGKSMVFDERDENHRSAGSFFVNPIVSQSLADDVERRAARQLGPSATVPRYPATDGRVKLPAAWLIERSGMPKGFGDGPVGLSTKHTLAVVNRGRATAAQVVQFASEVRRRVFDHFGVGLSHEPRLLGFEADEVLGLTAALV